MDVHMVYVFYVVAAIGSYVVPLVVGMEPVTSMAILGYYVFYVTICI